MDGAAVANSSRAGTDEALLGDDPKPRITLTIDPDKRTLTVATRNAARDPRIGDEVIRWRSAPDPRMPVTSPLWGLQDARSDRTGPRPARQKAASPTVGMAAAG